MVDRGYEEPLEEQNLIMNQRIAIAEQRKKDKKTLFLILQNSYKGTKKMKRIPL